jgi:LacI family transcriptional regulator
MTSRADGVVLTPPLCDDPDILALLNDNGTAYASLSPARQPANTPVMRLDDRLAAMEMVRHLVALGHTRIAFIAGPAGHNASTGRYEGYLDALSEAGLKSNPSLIAEGDYSLRSGLEAARKLIEADPRPTAIFAANDDMAVGAMTAIMAAGLIVPGEISIAGYDDTRLASAVWPALTTIRQPVAEMGRRAAERLMNSDDDHGLEELFDFDLIIRQSTGKASD